MIAADAVSARLAEAAGLREPIALARIGQGQSNLTFLATDAEGRRVVLRRALDDPRNAPDGGVPGAHVAGDLVEQTRVVAFQAGF